MQSRRLGCLTGMGLLSLLVTVLAISGIAVARGGLMYSPGPLNARSGALLGGVASHAETGGRCAACHSAPWSSVRMADLCVDCHGEIAVQMQDMVALHGAMYQKESKLECRACHPEHNGVDAALTDLQGGVFPHELLGFSLTGAHASLACEACHTAGQFAGLSPQCASCHADPDFHLGAFGANCADCHSTTAWQPASFERSHPEPRVDEGGSGIHHGSTTCRTCHPSSVREYTCLACHRDNQGGEGGE